MKSPVDLVKGWFAKAESAKVTLSFPDWKEGKVAPATFEIPVVDADAKPKQTR